MFLVAQLLYTTHLAKAHKHNAVDSLLSTAAIYNKYGRHTLGGTVTIVYLLIQHIWRIPTWRRLRFYTAAIYKSYWRSTLPVRMNATELLSTAATYNSYREGTRNGVDSLLSTLAIYN